MSKKRAEKRPVMRRAELEMKAAIAGREAVEKARDAGASPKVIGQLARGAKVRVIGGIEVRAGSLKCAAALDRCWATDMFKEASPIRRMLLMVTAYLKPNEAIAAMAKGEDDFLSLAEDFSEQVPMAELRDLMAEIQGHIVDLVGEGGGAKAAEPGESRR